MGVTVGADARQCKALLSMGAVAHILHVGPDQHLSQSGEVAVVLILHLGQNTVRLKNLIIVANKPTTLLQGDFFDGSPQNCLSAKSFIISAT